jgi:hypothetical protein
MKRGYVKLWRKSMDSPIFAHDGLWKLWCLCLIKATHKGFEATIPGILKPIKLQPGQFVTGRYSLHEDYHQADLKKRYSRKAAPTAYTLIRWLQTLQSMQMLSIKTYNKYSIITVSNWIQYQENEHQVSNRRASSEHIQTHNKHNKETQEKISALKNRYSDPELIDRAFKAIASTRKNNKVADSVLLAQLEKWGKYPPEQVETGIRTYLEKDYAGQGKREAYLLGIVRNNNDNAQQVPLKVPPMGKTAFALCVADYAAKNGVPVAFFSLEMAKLQCSYRLLSLNSNISLSKTMVGKILENEWADISSACNIVSDLPIYINDNSTPTYQEDQKNKIQKLVGTVKRL